METTNDRSWPIPDLHFLFILTTFKKHLSLSFLCWGHSSTGEHTTEARDAGVRLPVAPFDNIYKSKTVKSHIKDG